MYLGFNKNDTSVEIVITNKIDMSVENVKRGAVDIKKIHAGFSK